MKELFCERLLGSVPSFLYKYVVSYFIQQIKVYSIHNEPEI